MSLDIVAIKNAAVTVPNPYEMNEPGENDFAYRKRPELFKEDAAEFEKLEENYDQQISKANVDDLHIGYGAFYFARKALGEILGFHFIEDGPFNLHIQYDDTAPYVVELAEFFFHSDCDGKLEHNVIEVLDKVFRQHDEEIEALNNENVNRLVEFTNKTAKVDCYWNFE